MEISHLNKYSDPLLSTLLKRRWQRLQPLILGYDANKHGTPVFGEILPFFTADPQALSGWMGSIAAQLFSGLSRDVRSGSRTFRDLSWSHSCVVSAVCLGSLSCWKVNLGYSQVLSALEQAFIMDLCTLLCSSFPRSWLVSQSLPLKNRCDA